MKKDCPDSMQFQHDKSPNDQILVEFDGADETFHEGEHLHSLTEPGPKYKFVAHEVCD